MKMITIRKILTLAAFAFAHLIISCSNIADREEEFKAVVTAEQSKSECAYIKVNVENIDSGSRTLLPKVEISNLVLTGKRGSGETQVLASADTLLEMSAKQIELQTESNTETWKFTLTAKVSGVAYSSGEVSKEIKSGGENPLTFTLEPADGKTTGDLIFSINPIGTEGVEYEAILKIDDAEEPRYSFKNGETSPNWSLSLEAGTHTLTVEFYAKNANNQTDPTDPSLPKNSNSECLNIYKSIVRIEKGITTRAEVKNFNLNQVYSISYEGYEPTVKEGVPVADTLDPATSVMTLKFSRKACADSDGYIVLPKLSNSTMTFSGWYTKNPTAADFSESSKVAESGTAPNTVQKIKVRENLSNLTLYAKWLVEATGTIYSPTDYEFSFEAKDNSGTNDAPSSLYLGRATTLSIVPTVKRIESDGTKTTLYYNAEDNLLYSDTAFTTKAVGVNEVTWSAVYYNGDVKVADLDSSITGIGSRIKIALPAINYKDVYVLKVSANFLGVAHDTNIIFTYKNSLTGVNVPGLSAITPVTGSNVFIEGREAYAIRSLWVCDHETTQAEYVEIIGINPSIFADNPAAGEIQENRPVDNVNWFEAVIYCNRRSIMEGFSPCYTLAGSTNPDDWITAQPIPDNYDSPYISYWNKMECDFDAEGYRLPSNIEWEYFARGGSLTGIPTRWAGTDDENSVGDYAWYHSNSGGKTHEVKKKLPNRLGLYDLCGNVQEWTWDWNYIRKITPEFGETSGSYRSERGGSAYGLNDYQKDITITHLGAANASYRTDRSGFRVVRTVQ